MQLASLGRVNAQVVIQQGLGLGGLDSESKSGKLLAKALSTTASDENDTKVIEILRTYQRGMDLNLKAATDATGKFRKEAFACFSQAAEQGHVGAICQMVGLASTSMHLTTTLSSSALSLPSADVLTARQRDRQRERKKEREK